MNFYGYKGNYALGSEPLGSDNKVIWKDLTTVPGAVRRARSLWGDNFRLYTFTNFYDPKTFRQVHPRQGVSEKHRSRARDGGGMTRADRKFLLQLRSSFVPDLADLGGEDVARDLDNAIELALTLEQGMPFTRAQIESVSYLENTLIPDLYAHGLTSTAEDFERVVDIIKDVAREAPLARRLAAERGRSHRRRN